MAVLEGLNFEVDVVVTDVAMGAMSGIHLAKIIKKRVPTVKVLVNSSEPVKDHFLQAAGADAFVLKSGDREAFESALRRILVP